MLNPKYTSKDGFKTVSLRLTIKRSRTYLKLGFKTQPDNWISTQSKFKKAYNPETYKEDNERLRLIYKRANKILLELERENIKITPSTFKDKFYKNTNNNNFIELFDLRINEFENKGNIGNANVYRSSRNALVRFHKKDILLFEDITYKFLNRFEVFLSKTCEGNSMSVYFRTIKALYNNAVSRGLCKFEDSPFFNQVNQQGFKIKRLEKPTRKRAISHEDIKKMIDLKIEAGERLKDSQNILVFSFYNIGMNFIDLAYLKWENINNGRVMYRRQKTGKLFSIKILAPTQNVLDYYLPFKNELGYVFPIFTDFHKTEKQKKSRTKTALKKFNKEIKLIAKNANIENYELITSYVIRHSWASIMYKSGNNKIDIGRGFQHSSEKITDIYITELIDTSTDDMNETLLDL